MLGLGKAVEAEPGLALGPRRGMPQLCRLLRWLRPAINSQLRTGTDTGNPTV
jgi:hypothetical protein